jgi:hypothetical protein
VTGRALTVRRSRDGKAPVSLTPSVYFTLFHWRRIPALLLRDGPAQGGGAAGLEVFMVVRHLEIDFAARIAA